MNGFSGDAARGTRRKTCFANLPISKEHATQTKSWSKVSHCSPKNNRHSVFAKSFTKMLQNCSYSLQACASMDISFLNLWNSPLKYVKLFFDLGTHKAKSLLQTGGHAIFRRFPTGLRHASSHRDREIIEQSYSFRCFLDFLFSPFAQDPFFSQVFLLKSCVHGSRAHAEIPSRKTGFRHSSNMFSQGSFFASVQLQRLPFQAVRKVIVKHLRASRMSMVSLSPWHIALSANNGRCLSSTLY